MDEVGAFEAKTHLPKLLARVERGDSLTSTRHGRPVAQLVPCVRGGGDRALAAVRRIAALRKQLKKITLDELLALKHEGHRH
ncbi:MAG: type II toxin-antitoxin system Phd/YefM family antitoxin [Planctomycetia bacterium]